MWALLLIIMQGKRDEVVWCQTKVCEMNRVMFGSCGRSYEFILQIDWLGNRRK